MGTRQQVARERDSKWPGNEAASGMRRRQQVAWERDSKWDGNAATISEWHGHGNEAVSSVWHGNETGSPVASD